MRREEDVKGMPDPSITVGDMKKYGYSWDGMLPLSEAVATELYEKEDLPIFLLYSDGSESASDSVDDIRRHAERGGIMGVNREYWNALDLYKEMKQELEESAAEKEARLSLLSCGKEDVAMRTETYNAVILCGQCGEEVKGTEYKEGGMTIEEHYECPHCGYRRHWAYGCILQGDSDYEEGTETLVISREAEFRHLLAFAAQGYLATDSGRSQLRCLWTAYCFHHNLDADNSGYDSDLRLLWSVVEDSSEDGTEDGSVTADWQDYETFNYFMTCFLV